MESWILHAIAQHGYIALFSLLVLGIVGLPMPDEFLLTYSGYLVSVGEMSYLLTVMAASAGSTIGMAISFMLGRKLGVPFIEKYGRKIHITPERLAGAERWFLRFGRWAVSIGIFIPGVRHLTAYFAGISHWKFRTFVAYALAGAVAWSLAFITVGVLVGHRWRRITEYLHRYMVWVLILVVVGFGVWWLWTRWRKKANKNG